MVAGLEPGTTNEFLQSLALAANKKAESAACVQQILASVKLKGSKNDKEEKSISQSEVAVSSANATSDQAKQTVAPGNKPGVNKTSESNSSATGKMKLTTKKSTLSRQSSHASGTNFTRPAAKAEKHATDAIKSTKPTGTVHSKASVLVTPNASKTSAHLLPKAIKTSPTNAVKIVKQSTSTEVSSATIETCTGGKVTSSSVESTTNAEIYPASVEASANRKVTPRTVEPATNAKVSSLTAETSANKKETPRTVEPATNAEVPPASAEISAIRKVTPRTVKPATCTDVNDAGPTANSGISPKSIKSKPTNSESLAKINPVEAVQTPEKTASEVKKSQGSQPHNKHEQSKTLTHLMNSPTDSSEAVSVKKTPKESRTPTKIDLLSEKPLGDGQGSSNKKSHLKSSVKLIDTNASPRKLERHNSYIVETSKTEDASAKNVSSKKIDSRRDTSLALKETGTRVYESPRKRESKHDTSPKIKETETQNSTNPNKRASRLIESPRIRETRTPTSISPTKTDHKSNARPQITEIRTRTKNGSESGASQRKKINVSDLKHYHNDGNNMESVGHTKKTKGYNSILNKEDNSKSSVKKDSVLLARSGNKETRTESRINLSNEGHSSGTNKILRNFGEENIPNLMNMKEAETKSKTTLMNNVDETRSEVSGRLYNGRRKDINKSEIARKAEPIKDVPQRSHLGVSKSSAKNEAAQNKEIEKNVQKAMHYDSSMDKKVCEVAGINEVSKNISDNPSQGLSKNSVKNKTLQNKEGKKDVHKTTQPDLSSDRIMTELAGNGEISRDVSDHSCHGLSENNANSEELKNKELRKDVLKRTHDDLSQDRAKAEIPGSREVPKSKTHFEKRSEVTSKEVSENMSHHGAPEDINKNVMARNAELSKDLSKRSHLDLSKNNVENEEARKKDSMKDTQNTICQEISTVRENGEMASNKEETKYILKTSKSGISKEDINSETIINKEFCTTIPEVKRLGQTHEKENTKKTVNNENLLEKSHLDHLAKDRQTSETARNKEVSVDESEKSRIGLLKDIGKIKAATSNAEISIDVTELIIHGSTNDRKDNELAGNKEETEESVSKRQYQGLSKDWEEGDTAIDKDVTEDASEKSRLVMAKKNEKSDTASNKDESREVLERMQHGKTKEGEQSEAESSKDVREAISERSRIGTSREREEGEAALRAFFDTPAATDRDIKRNVNLKFSLVKSAEIHKDEDKDSSASKTQLTICRNNNTELSNMGLGNSDFNINKIPSSIDAAETSQLLNVKKTNVQVMHVIETDRSSQSMHQKNSVSSSVHPLNATNLAEQGTQRIQRNVSDTASDLDTVKSVEDSYGQIFNKGNAVEQSVTSVKNGKLICTTNTTNDISKSSHVGLLVNDKGSEAVVQQNQKLLTSSEFHSLNNHEISHVTGERIHSSKLMGTEQQQEFRANTPYLRASSPSVQESLNKSVKTSQQPEFRTSNLHLRASTPYAQESLKKSVKISQQPEFRASTPYLRISTPYAQEPLSKSVKTKQQPEFRASTPYANEVQHMLEHKTPKVKKTFTKKCFRVDPNEEEQTCASVLTQENSALNEDCNAFCRVTHHKGIKALAKSMLGAIPEGEIDKGLHNRVIKNFIRDIDDETMINARARKRKKRKVIESDNSTLAEAHMTKVIIETCDDHEGADEDWGCCVTPGLKNPFKDVKDIDEMDDYYIPGGRITSEISSFKAEDQAQHGSLVKKILETKNQTLVEIDRTETSSFEITENKKKLTIARSDMDNLRVNIQRIAQKVLNLTKILEFLQEDIDAMYKEKDIWRSEVRDNSVVLSREHSITESYMEPLQTQLTNIEREISCQLDVNASLKANILQNDDEIYKVIASKK